MSKGKFIEQAWIARLLSVAQHGQRRELSVKRVR
jgi:hypothetical protein